MPKATGWERWTLAALLALFVIAGAARLNPFCLLEPDIPDYLFTSRALATLDGYREIDFPEEPPHSFRPPGLALLLAPLSLVSPYDVVAAKAAVLATAVLALILLWLLARRACGPAGALSVTALMAASPYTLLFATEAMSELPFLACMLAILLLLDRETERPIALTLLLAFLPFIRTIGIVWIGAIGLWGLIDARRRRWSVVALIALAPTLLWSWRNSLAGGPTYFASIMSDLSGTLSKAGSQSWYYARECLSLLLPGIERGKVLYERVLIEPAPNLGGIAALWPVAALAATSLFLLGFYARRKEQGGLIALQTLLLIAALAIYPPRHERLIWPLIPLLWIYMLAGLRSLAGRRPRSIAGGRAVAILVGAALLAWQGAAAWRMVGTNLQWLRMGERFYSEMVPPMYFCDWQGAGRWIHDNSPPHARILTRHSDVGFTSRRYQDSLRFEELSPVAWRGRISQFGARYLVVPTTLFGRAFPAHLLGNDPVYRYVKVYEARDVAVLEVIPNREGTVGRGPFSVRGDLMGCRDALGRHPHRVDLVRRMSELLVISGRADQAEGVVRQAMERGVESFALHFSLGEVLEEQGRYGEARRAFERARSMAGAEELEKRIASGIARTRRMESARPGPRELLESARWKLSILRYDDAMELVQEALALAQDDREALALRAYLLRLGGHGAGEGNGRPSDPRGYLKLAMNTAREGLPGRALALLEEAVKLEGASHEVRRRLADLYLFYSMAGESEELYRAVLSAAPDDERARRGLMSSSALGRAPSF
jgi:tetratricopeptide (TPR) repeat protein